MNIAVRDIHSLVPVYSARWDSAGNVICSSNRCRWVLPYAAVVWVLTGTTRVALHPGRMVVVPERQLLRVVVRVVVPDGGRFVV